MRPAMTLALAAGLAAALAGGAAAAQFYLPFHQPPQRFVPAGEAGREFVLTGGVAAFSAPGVKVSGAGGAWEWAGYGRSGAGFSVRGYGYGLSGKVDPFSVGHTGGGGMTGGVEIDQLWAPRGKDSYRIYAGFLAGLSELDVRAPLVFQHTGGRIRVEPDTAFSLYLGFPAGVLVPFGLSGTWRGELQADVTFVPAGVTVFSFGGLASPVYGSSRGIDFDLSAGARAGVVYLPWKLSADLLGRLSSASGNNEPVACGALLVSLKIF